MSNRQASRDLISVFIDRRPVGRTFLFRFKGDLIYGLYSDSRKIWLTFLPLTTFEKDFRQVYLKQDQKSMGTFGDLLKDVKFG